MKDLKDFGCNDVIHCRTEQEADSLFELAKSHPNLKLPHRTYWNRYEENTVYYVDSHWFGHIANVDDHYIIHDASGYIKKPFTL